MCTEFQGKVETLRQETNLLEDPAFLRSVRDVASQQISAHLLARLLSIDPAKIERIEKQERCPFPWA
jgi:hypothetical protein